MSEMTIILSAAQSSFIELYPLIAYLEESMMQPGITINKPIKWLSIDFSQLSGL